MFRMLRYFIMVCIAASAWTATGQQLSSYVTAPMAVGELLESTAENDLFAKFPEYPVDSIRQTWVKGGWKGRDDYHAKVQFGWTKDALYIQFRMWDDEFSPSNKLFLDNLTGDYILIRMSPDTAAPKDVQEPFQILLLPDPANQTCRVKVFSELVSPLSIGKPEIKLTLNDKRDYTLILKIPTERWTKAPANTRTIFTQIIFGDSDIKGTVDHVFGLFPPRAHGGTFMNTNGVLHFAEQLWARLIPTKAKYDTSEVALSLDYGNLTKNDVYMQVEILDEEDKVVQKIEKAQLMKKETSRQGMTVTMPFDMLKPGIDYKVRSKADAFWDPGTFLIRRDKANPNLFYCPEYIERRIKTQPRPLAAYADREKIRQTLRFIAGGGRILWSAGKYDASSDEFPARILPNGPFEIEIGAGKAVLPWALFGGADLLDEMNEPIVLKLGDLLQRGEAFKPQLPGFEKMAINKKYMKTQAQAKKLLLIGLVSRKMVGSDVYPIIKVSAGRRVITEERLRPSTTQSTNQRHSYVLRAWLNGDETNVQIENVTPHGPKVEIDFMCLVGAGPKPEFAEGDPRISFSGSPGADVFSQMLAVTTFFARNYLVDKGGRIHRSLPGGRYQQFSLRDHVLLLGELANWGYMDEIQPVMKVLPLCPRWVTPEEKKQGSIGLPLLVNAVHNYWRKNGRERRIAERYWHSIVRRQLEEVSLAQGVNTMGLINTSGEFGTPPGEGGASVPVVMAARAALQSGVTMAKDRGYDEDAERWSKLDETLASNFNRYLVAQPGGLSVQSAELYKAAHGLPDIKGIQSKVPEQAWVYARNANKEPIPYYTDIRVFDSPYVFAGLPLLFDARGYQLSASEIRQLSETMLFIRTSPVLKRPSFVEHSLVTYKCASTHVWTTMATLAMDNTNFGANLTDALAQYSFDEYLNIPDGADVEISPFTLEQKLNVSPNGENAGPTLDECNAMDVAYLMKLARQITGIDDYNHKKLVIMPRLPSKWKIMEVNDWVVCHDFGQDHTAVLNMTYKNQLGTRSIDIELNRAAQEIEILLGPFPAATRNVRLTLDNDTKLVRTKRINRQSWVVINQKRVLRLKASARASGY